MSKTPSTPGSDLSQPRDLKVNHDLASMRYTVSVWEKLLPAVFVRWLCAYAVFGLICSALAGVLWLADPELVATLPILANALNIFYAPSALMVVLFSLRKRARVNVQVDQQGMTLEAWNGFRRVTWAACEDVKLNGRIVEIKLDDSWHPLPSPNAYTDAQWLQQQIKAHIEARQGGATAPPEEVAAALAALNRRAPASR